MPINILFFCKCKFFYFTLVHRIETIKTGKNLYDLKRIATEKLFLAIPRVYGIAEIAKIRPQ
jgi:hypothetical protein